MSTLIDFFFNIDSKISQILYTPILIEILFSFILMLIKDKLEYMIFLSYSSILIILHDVDLYIPFQ